MNKFGRIVFHCLSNRQAYLTLVDDDLQYVKYLTNGFPILGVQRIFARVSNTFIRRLLDFKSHIFHMLGSYNMALNRGRGRVQNCLTKYAFKRVFIILN